MLIIILAHFTFFRLTAQDTTLYQNDAAQTVADTSKNIIEKLTTIIKRYRRSVKESAG